jgi:phage shock protein A
MEAGTLEDLTGGRDEIDRELGKISTQSNVESELARLKAEAGKGSEKAKSGEESTEERKEV